MDPENPRETFISKAKAPGGAERANSRLFVFELCKGLGVPRPENASEDTSLEKRERSSLGAHYTARACVEWLVVPVIIEPLREDWAAVQARVHEPADQDKDRDALNEVRRFHRRLCTTRVLDPACGTGNFLYVSLELMKRLEGEVVDAIADLGRSA